MPKNLYPKGRNREMTNDRFGNGRKGYKATKVLIPRALTSEEKMAFIDDMASTGLIICSVISTISISALP